MAKFCSKCGTPIKGNEKFCPKCGISIGPEISANTTQTMETSAVQKPKHSSHKKAIIIGVIIAVLVAAGGGGTYWYLMKSNDKVATTTTETSKTSTSDENGRQNTEQNVLTKVQEELQKRGISGTVVATSYGHNPDGCLVILKGGIHQLVVWDQKNDQVAYISGARNEDNVYYFQGKRSHSSLTPILFNLTILNAQHGQDDGSGAWDGTTHILPIYGLYDLDGNGDVIPGRLTTGSGIRPSHYHGYLYAQRNVDVANLVLTEMRALHIDAGKRNVQI